MRKSIVCMALCVMLVGLVSAGCQKVNITGPSDPDPDRNPGPETRVSVTSVTVSPVSVNLTLVRLADGVSCTATQMFIATVSGDSVTQTVTWRLSGTVAGASVSPTGLFTASATTPTGTVRVIATSTQNIARSGEASVNVVNSCASGGGTPSNLPRATLDATPSTIRLGDSTRLSWDCDGTNSVYYESVSGNVVISTRQRDHQSVNPTVTTTYRQSCVGTGGTSYNTRTVTVLPSTDPPPGTGGTTPGGTTGGTTPGTTPGGTTGGTTPSGARVIVLSPSDRTVTMGSTLTLSVTCTVGGVAVSCTPIYTSSAPSNFYVNQTAGTVTFISTGAAQICAVWTGATPSCRNYTVN